MSAKRATAVYVTATVIMGAGLLRAEVHPHYDDSSIFELVCFLVASALLAFPLVWLWRSRKEHFRLLVLFMGSGGSGVGLRRSIRRSASASASDLKHLGCFTGNASARMCSRQPVE
jgi:hypothetical protein